MIAALGTNAAALYEHLTGPVAANPERLGKLLDAPFQDVLSTGAAITAPLRRR